VVPLAYWPGKEERRRWKDTMVVQMGARRLLKSTARMMCDPHVQLLAPLVVYTGASVGFVLNDFTVVSTRQIFIVLLHIHEMNRLNALTTYTVSFALSIAYCDISFINAGL